MRRIFISYRRDDSKSVSSRIYDRLAQQFGKQNVFKDVNVIPPGVDFREYIQQEIAKADTVLVVIGTRWKRILQERATDPRDFVRLEIESAFQQNKLVIPVLVEGAEAVDDADLPESIMKLAYLNSARVDDDPDFHPHMDKLIDSLREPTPPPPAPPRKSSRLPFVFGGLTLGVALIAGVVFMSNSATNTPDPLAINQTATVQALPLPNEETSPLLSSFGSMALLAEPSDNASVIDYNARPLPIVGRNDSGGYYLVYSNQRYAWVRLNTFSRVQGDTSELPIVSYIAPTPTPQPIVEPTSRPTPTPRPTSEYAADWIIMSVDEIDDSLPTGWSGLESVDSSFGEGLMSLIGQNNFDERLVRSGYSINTGVTVTFRFLADDNADFGGRLFFERGQLGQDTYRFFGIEPTEGNFWYVTSIKGRNNPIYQNQFELQPNTVYALTILIDGSDNILLTLVDTQTNTRVFDNRLYELGFEWSATVSDPINWLVNPLSGTLQIDRVQSLLKVR
jgi:hypothetical protein